MTITQIVNQAINRPTTGKAKETTRFMLVLEDETRDQLRDLCEELGVKQIKFASDIFTTALANAEKAYQDSLKK